MSFILDALKKSEQQRQLGKAPTLHVEQSIVNIKRQPAHFLYGVIAMVLVAAGMLIGWWQPWQADKILAATTTTARVGSSSSRQDVADFPPIPPKPIAVPAPAAAPVSPPSPTPATPSGIASRPSIPPAPVQSIMTMAELPLSIQHEIPKMSISVHAFSSTPAKRFATINDQTLHEGEYLTPGLKLDQITSSGLVFSYKGYRFLFKIH